MTANLTAFFEGGAASLSKKSRLAGQLLLLLNGVQTFISPDERKPVANSITVSVSMI
jgi:hypothetical protein